MRAILLILYIGRRVAQPAAHIASGCAYSEVGPDTGFLADAFTRR